jgi:hypothetical protein
MFRCQCAVLREFQIQGINCINTSSWKAQCKVLRYLNVKMVKYAKWQEYRDIAFVINLTSSGSNGQISIKVFYLQLMHTQ